MDANISSEFQKALQFEQHGDLASAKKCYESILIADPTHELSLHGLALTFARMGDIGTKNTSKKFLLLIPKTIVLSLIWVIVTLNWAT